MPVMETPAVWESRASLDVRVEKATLFPGQVAPCRPMRALFCMVGAALSLRVAAIFVFHTYVFRIGDFPTGPNFAFGYETGSIAGSIASGLGFASPFGIHTGPTAWIAPVYPYLCAAVFKLFGLYTQPAAIAMLSLNSLFAALTCIPIYLLGERFMGRTAALWAGWTWAVCPLFFRWPITWVWEISLSALLSIVLVVAVVELAESGSRRGAIAWGVLAGFAALVNPGLLTIVGVCWFWLILRQRRLRRNPLRPALLAATLAALVISPWLVRNAVVFGRPVFIRSNFWFEFDLGNYHLSNGMGWGGRHPTLNPGEFRSYQNMGEVAYVEAKRAQSLAFLHQYPGEFLRLTAQRVLTFWNGDMYHYQPQKMREASFYGPFSVLALGGLALALWRRAPLAWLLAAVGLLYPLPYYVTYSQARYRHAIEPVLLMTSVYLVAELYRVVARHRAPAEARPAPAS